MYSMTCSILVTAKYSIRRQMDLSLTYKINNHMNPAASNSSAIWRRAGRPARDKIVDLLVQELI